MHNIFYRVLMYYCCVVYCCCHVILYGEEAGDEINKESGSLNPFVVHVTSRLPTPEFVLPLSGFTSNAIKTLARKL